MDTIMINGTVTMLLVIFTICDMKTRTIWMPLAVLAGSIGILIRMAFPGQNLVHGIFGAAAGLLLLAVSYLSRGGIGRGDCYVLSALGALLGVSGMLEVFVVAVLFAAIWSCILLISRKADRKTKMPFMPFMLAAWAVVRFSG